MPDTSAPLSSTTVCAEEDVCARQRSQRATHELSATLVFVIDRWIAVHTERGALPLE